jgi:hypothetical protein
MDEPKNIKEYVVKKVIEYALEHNKLKRKYDDLKKQTKNVICKHCKCYSSQKMMGKRCGHTMCHPCWSVENSLIFYVDLVNINRNDCIKCLIKNGSLVDLKGVVSEWQQNYYKEYFSHFDN